MSNFLSIIGRSRKSVNVSRSARRKRQRPLGHAVRSAIESLEGRVLLAVINNLTDSFTGTTIDSTKWNMTTRGLENNSPTTYDLPSESPGGLVLGGTTSLSYWYGNSLESVDSFSSQATTNVSVERVSLTGSGSAYRSSLWILQPGGQYLHFSQNTENGWSYNPSGTTNATGSGIGIPAFSSLNGDHGDHVMKLVYTPGVGNTADVGIYLDGNLGTTYHFASWDQSIPFNVIVTGQARAANDTVEATFENLSAKSDPIPTQPPAAPSNLIATAAAHGLGVNLSWLDNANNEVNYRLERSTDGTNFTEFATVPAVANSGTTATYSDLARAPNTKFFYRVRAFNNANGGSFSNYATANATTAPFTTFVDPLTGAGVDTTKWNITNRGLEGNGPAGYNPPTEDATGLTLGGATSLSYWFGSSLESKDAFSSQVTTTVSVERVSLSGTGSAWRSSLWLLQPTGSAQFLHFAQDVKETNWQFNQTAGNIGTAIAPFNTATADGDHVMKVVYTPLGGSNAKMDMYLDGVFGATATFTNWDNNVPFIVILTGQGRAAGDTVAAQFKNVSVDAVTSGPAAPTNLTALAAAHGLGVNLSWLDNATNEVNYHIERSSDGVNFKEIGTVNSVAGSGSTGTFSDTAPGANTKFYYRVRAFNNFNNGTFSAYANANVTTAPGIFSLSDPLTGNSVDTTKWDITNRGLENNGDSGYDAPKEDPTGLTLGGTTINSYWYGSSLESKDVFYSQATTTVTVDRVSLIGSGSAYRSALWLLQPGGSYLHFAQNINESDWEYNQNNTGGGTSIDAFNTNPFDPGDHVMKLVYTPLGGSNATIDMYLDGVLGATATYNNWDNTLPFKVILTGEARAAGDEVSALFKDFHADSVLPAAPPAAPTALTATATASGVNLGFNDNSSNELLFSIERSIDGTNFSNIANVPANPGTGALTYTDTSALNGITYFYRVRAFNYNALGAFSSPTNIAIATSLTNGTLTDPLTGPDVNTSLWDITGRGLENNGDAGYNAPFEDPFGLNLGGFTNNQYWFGSSLESKQTFSSMVPTTVQVDRVTLSGTGSAWRSSLWMLQPGGSYLHYSQDINESDWSYNQNNTGGGTSIGAFNTVPFEQGDHIMKLVYTPLGGTNATVDIYLDGILGTTVTYNNWDNSVPFKVILTGQARATGDSVSAEFRDVSVTPAIIPPVIITGTANADNFYVKRDADGVHGDVWINSATPGIGAPSQQYLLNQAGPEEIDGLDSNDKLTVDYALGSPIPAGGLNFQGGTGTDTLKAIGSGATDAFGLVGTSINHLGGGILSAPGSENLSISGGNFATPSLTLGGAGNFAAADIGVGGTLRVIYTGASPAATIRGYLTTGRAGGTWNGPGISSADVATHPGTALGYSDVGGIVTVKYTLAGDVNLDGTVGFADLVAVAQNYGASGATVNWSRGDVNYDNAVGFADLVAVAQGYGKSLAAPAVGAAPVLAPVTSAPISVPVISASVLASTSAPVATPVKTTVTTAIPSTVTTTIPSTVAIKSKSVSPPVTPKIAPKPVAATRPTVFAAHTSLQTLGRAQALNADVLGKKSANANSLFR